MKKDDGIVNTSITAKPRRRLSAGKSKLPASLTPQMQSLNRTQQFLSTHQPAASHSKKQQHPATQDLPNLQVLADEEAKDQHNPILTTDENEQQQPTSGHDQQQHSDEHDFHD